MNYIEKSKINVKLDLPKTDFSDWKDNKSEIKVTTEHNTITNQFTFKLRIPSYIFNKIKDTDEKYLTNPPKPKRSFESKHKKFTQNISSPWLSVLLDELNKICIDCMSVTEREEAETEKYIAIKFTHSHKQQKDNFNFASMGFNTGSSFQFFTVYKVIQSPNSLNRYIYKSKIRISGNVKSYKDDLKNQWHFYSPGVVEQFQLVRWSEEREDFLQNIQNKFVEINDRLNHFLGKIDEEKIHKLINNGNLLLSETFK